MGAAARRHQRPIPRDHQSGNAGDALQYIEAPPENQERSHPRASRIRPQIRPLNHHQGPQTQRAALTPINPTKALKNAPH